MGQYRQWLYHREVDQQLHAKLATLQQEMRSTQEQAALLEDTTSKIDNPIIQALAMQREILLAADPTPYMTPKPFLTHPTSAEQPTHTISDALFAWSHLPNLDTEEIHLRAAWASEQEDPQPVLQVHSDINLLPEDIVSFIDTHTQAIPKLATYSHPSTRITKLDLSTAFSDSTDRSIQRWIERWGHKPPAIPYHAPRQMQPQEDMGE